MFDPAGLPAELRRADDSLGGRSEDAGITSSQPPEQTIYDGWLLRYSPGKAKRARSVNAIAAGARTLDEKLAHVEAFYERVGLPCVFRITPYTQPPPLDAALADHGFLAREESRVMWTELQKASGPVTQAGRFTTLSGPEFADLVARLRGSPPAQAAAERQRIAHLALPALYTGLMLGDQPVSSGCVVIDDDVAGIFNMVTTPEQRGQGHATAIVEHLLQHASAAGARWAYLQVDAANAAARGVYRKFGFRDRYAYWYRARPPQGELL